MKYSKRAFHFAILNTLLLIVFLILSGTGRTQGNNINDFTGYMITLFLVTVVLGFIFSMLSLKEAYHWKKYAGIGINLLYFVLLAMALAGNLMDIAEVMG